jgi:hypothetical protein
LRIPVSKVAALFAAVICFLFLCVFASGALAQSGSVYVDSQHRFTVRVPRGWVAKPFNTAGVSGVTIAHGEDAYVQIFLQKGIDPASFLKALNTGLQNSHPGYRISDQGTRTVAGQSRMYIAAEAAETPTAPHARVYLETFAADGLSYAIIASSSAKDAGGKELASNYDTSQEVIRSFAIKGMPAESPPAKEASAAPAAKAPPAPKPARPAAPVSAPQPAPSPVPSPAPASTTADVVTTENSSETLSPDDQKKLAALDAALKGGALSEDEYQKKKNVLYAASRPQQDNAAVLKALDQALQDGVLTQDEYHRKRRELGAEVASAPPPSEPNPDTETPALKPTEGAVANSEPRPEPLPKSWTTDNDPSGFVVNLPASWTVGKLRATGQIVIHGTRGEEIMIWPLRLKQPELDARGASAMLQELARKFDALMPWSAVRTMPSAARVIGLGSQRSATAVLSWANNSAGASVYFYGVEAPSDVYPDTADAFAAILKSFQIVQDPALKAAPGPASASPLHFVSWSDPHEGAFTVSVPQGWHVVGGTYHLSTEDVRYSVVLVSPDGLVRASLGDSLVGTFTQPTQTLAAAGVREGGYETLPDGTRAEVLRYLSGQQFARSYVDTLVSRQCGKPQVSSNSDREDFAAQFSQLAATQGFTDALLTAGDVGFSCSMDGRPVKGKYIAATLRMGPNVSPMWFVYRLSGFLAFAGREQDGENVLIQLIQSWKLDSEWEALLRNAANPAAQPDPARAQETRERAQAAIADDQRQISEMFARSAEQREKLNDQFDRKRQSATLGTLDIVDRESGAQYRLSDFSDYHYLSNEGCLRAANSQDGTAPNWREMLALQ